MGTGTMIGDLVSESLVGTQKAHIPKDFRPDRSPPLNSLINCTECSQKLLLQYDLDEPLRRSLRPGPVPRTRVETIGPMSPMGPIDPLQSVESVSDRGR